jgi:hypothetical protein
MEMVIRFLDPASNTHQCELANTAFGLQSCCTTSPDAGCNASLLVDDVVREWGNAGCTATRHDQSITFAAVKAEIAANRAAEIGWDTYRGGHSVLVVGWSEIGAEQLLKLNDPAVGERVMSYAEVDTAAAIGSWAWTWDGIQRQAAQVKQAVMATRRRHGRFPKAS